MAANGFGPNPQAVEQDRCAAETAEGAFTNEGSALQAAPHVAHTDMPLASWVSCIFSMCSWRAHCHGGPACSGGWKTVLHSSRTPAAAYNPFVSITFTIFSYQAVSCLPLLPCFSCLALAPLSAAVLHCCSPGHSIVAAYGAQALPLAHLQPNRSLQAAIKEASNAYARCGMKRQIFSQCVLLQTA